MPPSGSRGERRGEIREKRKKRKKEKEAIITQSIVSEEWKKLNARSKDTMWRSRKNDLITETDE